MSDHRSFFTLIMGVKRAWAYSSAWVTLIVLVGVSVPTSRALQRRSAAADPTPVADPNLAALSGLSGLTGESMQVGDMYKGVKGGGKGVLTFIGA